ncbi:MAG: hypothetical protein M3367_00590 [Acidobacteriota bacterium]|nr:hypothetical protein [Acidobacteriota bacterium]
MKRTIIITSLLVLCCMDEVVRAQQKDVASHLQPEHREVVQQWLASSKLALRVATLADNSNKEGLAITRKERGKGYHPYYAVGDFNSDRKQDFAIALINERKSKGPFAIAIFNGPVSKNSVPAYFSEGWDLSDGGLFGDKTSVMAGVFESDDCVIFRKSGKKYVTKGCIEE